MIRDQGPRNIIRYGVTNRFYDEKEDPDAGGNPEGGFLARKLEGHPIARFLSTAATTMVVMGVAGALVRKGGVRLATDLEARAAGKLAAGEALNAGERFATGALRDVRRLRELIDEWEVTKLYDGDPEVLRGFEMDRERTIHAIRTHSDPNASWTLKKELISRFSTQARRLPYELPAAYVAQRAFIDPIFGEEKSDVKWYNPVDVISDFAEQSLKNIVFMVGPMEGAMGAGKYGFNRFMSWGRQGARGGVAGEVSQGVQNTLHLVGQDFSNFIGGGGLKPNGQQRVSLYNRTLQTASSFRQGFQRGANSGYSLSRVAADAYRDEGSILGAARAIASGRAASGNGFWGGFTNEWREFNTILAKPRLERQSEIRKRLPGMTLVERMAHDIDELAAKRGSRFQSGSFFRRTLGDNSRVDPDSAEDLWNQLYDEQVIPFIEARLGRAKIPHEIFEMPPDQKGARYLYEQLAHHAGVSFDKTTDTAEIARQLRAKGLPTDRPELLKAFLQKKGVVTKEWQKDGFNIFGFRPLTLDEAVNENYFGYLEGSARSRIEEIAGKLTQQSDTMGMLKQVRVGPGVWKTRSGEIVDISPIAEAFKRGMDAAADHLQIPLIHTSPFQLFHYSARRSLSQRPLIEVGFDDGAAKLLPDEFRDNDMFMAFNWGRKSYGVGVRRSASGGLRYDRMEGLRAAPTDPKNYYGKHGRLAIGDTGFQPDFPSNSKFKRFFSINEDQPDSILGWAKRWHKARRGTGLDDRWFTPEMLAGDITDPELYTKLGQASPVMRARFTRAFEQMERKIQTHGRINDRVLRELERENPELAALFKSDYFDPLTGGRALNQEFDDLATAAQHPRRLVNFARQVLSESQNYSSNMVDQTSGIPIPDALKVLENRLQSILREGNFESLSSREMRSVGINRKIDELREELTRYLVVREQIVYDAVGSSSPLARVQDPIQTLLGTVENLRQAGRLSRTEYNQARTAVLSMEASRLRAVVKAQAKAAGRQASPDESIRQTISVAKELGARPIVGRAQAGAKTSVLDDFSSYRYRAKNEAHRRVLEKSVSPEYDKGEISNPFGESKWYYLPKFSNAFERQGAKAVRSVLGIGTWKNPEAFSRASIPGAHLWERLNRYFGTLGMALDPNDFRGPLDLYVRGMVGKRVLPVVAAGTALYTVDAELGGAVHKDDQGRPVYRPLVMGAAARGVAAGQVALAGLTPGGQTAEEKRKELFEGEVPVRKGRWWPLGNTPFEGGRIMYYRPSWYRRFTSGYKYTGQLWDSPMEKLMYGYDFSPGKFLSPYHWEKKHFEDRPYPVTGEMFTGPWGPLTGFLNLTVGKILKPETRMHKAEVDAAMKTYVSRGEFGMSAPQVPVYMGPNMGGLPPEPLYVNDRGRIKTAYQTTAATVLGEQSRPGFGSLPPSRDVFMQQMVRRSIGMGPADRVTAGSAISPGGTVFSSGGRVGLGIGPGVELGMGVVKNPYGPNIYSAQSYSQSADLSRQALERINERYKEAADRRKPLTRGQALQNPYFVNTRLTAGGTIMPNMPPTTPGSMSVQAGQLGYELQEMAGIFGFMFGSGREALGLGTQDFSPRRPVFTAASRAYGSERGFWDLQLGGAGDLPTPIEGEYANLELSEIIRRFIPHRRRDITEVNPIANRMGKEYSWLPGSNYFINFKQGDPYSLISEGEMRLPGAAYERFNKLNPDTTGRYGLIDQFKILGDVAPYSDQYKALDRIMNSLDLSPERKALVTQTRKQVSSKKEVYRFSRYKYAHQDFDKQDFTIAERVEGSADKFITKELGPNQPIRLAGVRARSEAAQQYMDQILRPGTKIRAEFDRNSPEKTLDVIADVDGKNVNEMLLRSGLGTKAKTSHPIDERLRSGPVERNLKALGEWFGHRDTAFNTKFFQNRTAQEDWERRFVYGATFPQWQHPIRDYLTPMVERRTQQHPILATVGMAGVARLFAKEKSSKAVASVIGGTIGFASSMYGNVKEFVSGRRHLPKDRVQELAVEEYTDILKYMKFTKLYGEARQQAVDSGEVDPEIIARKAQRDRRKDIAITVGAAGQRALQYRKEIGRTMYGADPFGDLTDLMMAIPKRKREHFQEMLNAPKNERGRILSTSGRLERRILEARWGMNRERRPDLKEYFSKRELPGPNWEGWDPSVDLDHVKLKVIQHQGLDASQLGYYPQQLREANLANPSYPDMNKRTNPNTVAAQIRKLLSLRGISGSVVAVPNNHGDNRVQLNAGVY